MRYPAFVRNWARRRVERMLPRLEAELSDAEDRLARTRRFDETFGGRRRRILDQEDRVERLHRRIAKLRQAAST